MVARVANVFMRNFVVVTMKLNEGNLTRADVIGPNGGIIEDVVSYASQLEKGDLIIMDPAATSNDIMVATAAPVSAVGLMHGVLVSQPFGVDEVTVSGAPPAITYQRVADVALFGLGIIELEAADTVVPGDSLPLDSAAAGHVGTAKEGAAAATLASNGGLMALTKAIDGQKVAVLVNAFFAVAE